MVGELASLGSGEAGIRADAARSGAGTTRAVSTLAAVTDSSDAGRSPPAGLAGLLAVFGSLDERPEPRRCQHGMIVQ